MSAALRAAGLGRASPGAVGLEARVLEDHRQRIHAHRERGVFPGLAEAIIVDGKVVYLDTCGCAHGELSKRMTERTLFRGYSMMKPITVTAFLSLVEQGLLGMDDPVARYLPRFEGLKVRRKGGRGLERLKRPMTLRHLAMHTSGFGYGPGTLDQTTRAVARTAGEKIYRDVSARQDTGDIDTLEKLCDALCEKPLLFQPGTAYEYGLGLDVLGRIMEIVTGMPLRRLIQERVLRPTGMRDATWDVPHSAAEEVCGYYRLMRTPGRSGRWLERLDGSRPEDSAYVRGSAHHYGRPAGVPAAGGFWGTFRTAMLFSMRDVLLFCQMLLNEGVSTSGVRVLGAETVRSTLRNWFQLRRAVDAANPPGWNSSTVGWCPLGNVQLTGPHAGALFMGGMSYFWLDPRRKMACAIMTETYWQVRPLGWKDKEDNLEDVLQRASKMRPPVALSSKKEGKKRKASALASDKEKSGRKARRR